MFLSFKKLVVFELKNGGFGGTEFIAGRQGMEGPLAE